MWYTGENMKTTNHIYFWKRSKHKFFCIVFNFLLHMRFCYSYASQTFQLSEENIFVKEQSGWLFSTSNDVLSHTDLAETLAYLYLYDRSIQSEL